MPSSACATPVTVPSPPAAVLHRKFGDCKDQATLLVAALRARGIGVNVHYIPVLLHPYYRERFGTVVPAVDDLARSLRVVDDLSVGESATVLRIDPA